MTPALAAAACRTPDALRERSPSPASRDGCVSAGCQSTINSPPQQLDEQKAAAPGAEAPADDGEHNIQRIACGDAETQSDAAADPVAHGVADQQKKSGPGLSRATKWDRASAGKTAGKSVDKVCIVASIMVQRPPYARWRITYCQILICFAHTAAAWRRYS